MNFKNIVNFDGLRDANLKHGDIVHLKIKGDGKSFSTEDAEFVCDAGHLGVIFNLGGLLQSRTWEEIEELWPIHCKKVN